MNTLENAGFSRSNPYFYVEQGKARTLAFPPAPSPSPRPPFPPLTLFLVSPPAPLSCLSRSRSSPA